MLNNVLYLSIIDDELVKTWLECGSLLGFYRYECRDYNPGLQ